MVLNCSYPDVNKESVVIANRELLRACYTNNIKLLEKILTEPKTISSIWDRFAPSNDFNALELAVASKNKKMLNLLIEVMNGNNKIQYAYKPTNTLKEVTTGSNDKYAYGV